MWRNFFFQTSNETLKSVGVAFGFYTLQEFLCGQHTTLLFSYFFREVVTILIRMRNFIQRNKILYHFEIRNHITPDIKITAGMFK